MTEPASSSSEQSTQISSIRWWRLFAQLFGALLGLSLLIFSTGFWLVSTESGAKLSLALLQRSTGIQFQGISGNLNHQLHIQHVEMRTKEMELSADDIALQWHPKALFKHQIQLDYLRINNVELALAAGDGQPARLPQTLQLPHLIKLLNADQLEVGQFQLSDMAANHQRVHPQQFSMLKASISVNSSDYKVQFSGATPWGNAQVKGNLTSIAPFNIQAQINWVGLEIKEHDVTLPQTSLNGKVFGNLSKIQIQAQLNTLESDKETRSKSSKQLLKTGTPTRGEIRAVLTPFAILPIDAVQLDFVAVNPASFYKNAPEADLELKADFHMTGDAKSPILRGHIGGKNTKPQTWNAGGIPVAQLDSDLTLSEHKITWKNTRIDFEQGGFALGEGELILANSANAELAKAKVLLPMLMTQFDIRNINLLRLDSRLKKTQLSGKIQAQNKNQELNFGLHLQETDPKLNAQMHAVMSLDNQLKLTLQQLELNAKDATLTASGSIALQGKQEFSLKGEAHNFNPARWIDVPDGHVASRFQATGQVQNGWQVAAQLLELSGQFAGLDLHGEADFYAQQDRFLAIKKCEVNWGKNHLSAQGNWQLGNHLDVSRHEQLHIALAVPELAALSHPFEKIMTVSLRGSLFVDGVLSGNAVQPSGHFSIKASQLAIPNVIYLDAMQANLALSDGAQGEIDGNLVITGMATSAPTSNEDDRFKIEQLEAKVSGLRHAQTLSLTASLPQQQQIILRAEGDLQDANSAVGNEMQWVGKVFALNLSGPLDFQLQSPFSLLFSRTTAQMGEANWQGKLGHLHVQQLSWLHGQIKTSGQFQEIPVVKILKLWRNDFPVSGKLMLDASWQLDVGQQIAGQMQIQRTSGDLLFQDTSNANVQSIALGLQKLILKTSIGNSESVSTSASISHQQIKTSIQAQGDQLGLINVDLMSYLNKTEQGWELQRNAPLSAQASLQIKDIGWMSQFLGYGISLRGALDVQAKLNGVFDKPEYQAKISGKELQVSFTELGILLPNGELEASIDENQFKLDALKFSQTIKKPPKHEYLTNLGWLSQTGYVESTGSIDLHTWRGTITTIWEKFPFLQNPESWMVASGRAQLSESEHSWNVTGKLIADAAYFSVPKQAAPKLSSDVVVLKKNAKRPGEKSGGLQTSLDFSISTGKNFIFVGRGLDTRLDGDLRIRSKNGGTLLATGSIQTTGGSYEGYGQQLAIDRGILNFQGPIDNPGLNVRAIRRGLPVEAGVEVVGTVAKPEVHLISEPNVPDPDKLSWMVLGRGSDQMAGSEAALLMSAAGAIFGGDNGSNIPSSIAHTLGLEDLSFGTTSTSPESQLPTQTVAGTINSTSSNEQVFSVGKRIAPDLVFSIERSLTDASNGLKLTWQLTRRFSIIGRAGSDTAIDGQYTFSFD